MKILTRYMVKTMTFYTIITLLIWLGIYAFFSFIDEVDNIGQANYTIIEAIIYVGFDLPSVAYSHAPVIILLGTLLALANLASTAQLIVIRGAGMSIMKIAGIAVKIALMFMLVAIFVGELIAPTTLEYAENSRVKALGGDVSASNQRRFWLKDGKTIMHMKKAFDGRLFKDVMLVNIGKSSNQLDSVVSAKQAVFDGKSLTLQHPNRYQLDHNNQFSDIQLAKDKQYNIQVSFNHELLDSMNKKSSELSTWNLYQQINFLAYNNLATKALQVELYKRLVKPVTLVAMVLFSMLFVFGSLRNSSLGKKIFLGAVISVFFELATRLGGALSLRFDYNPLLSASAPTIVVLILAFILLRRKSVR